MIKHFKYNILLLYMTIEQYLDDLTETILFYIDSYCVQLLSYPNYELQVYTNVCLYLLTILPEEIYDEELFEPYINDIIDYYFIFFHEPRSYSRDLHINTENKEIIQQQINELIKKEQPEQKSNEWYIYRHNLITASSAWKILDSESNRNNFIYNKCEPINLYKYKNVNINSPFHWGNKYEPLSVSLYEYLYKTKIMDFGCIQHNKYYFLGASPDGINVDKNSNLYGRMLEIKNIFNREITGIPKREYWIQMQLQMEVCDLNDCDFLECRFKEYENEEAFNNDGTFQYTKENKMKGIKLQFFDNNQPVYEYAPFLCNKEDFELWREQCMEKNSTMTWIKDIYWWLEEYSCVLVPRNKLWFQSIINDFQEIWKIIEKERISGYNHRKPKKREKIKVKTILETIVETIPETEKKKKKEKKEKINKPVPVFNITTEILDTQ